MAINRRRVRELLAGFNFKALFTSELGWGKRSMPCRPSPSPTAAGCAGASRGWLGSRYSKSSRRNPTPTRQACPTAANAPAFTTQIEAEAFNNVLIFLDDDRAAAKACSTGSSARTARSVRASTPTSAAARRPDDEQARSPGGRDRRAGRIRRLFAFAGDRQGPRTRWISSGSPRSSTANFAACAWISSSGSDGIPDEAERAWYASVLLNRLMFIYFLQRKRFINDDHRYLENQPARQPGARQRPLLQRVPGALFFQGFAKPERHRSPEARALLAAASRT